MDTRKIRKMIEEAVAHEARTGNLAQAVRDLAALKGRRITEADVAGVVDVIKIYVGHVPAVMDEADKAAKNYQDVRHLLDAAQRYFFDPFDFIPDHMGLIGLMDDAYFAHCVLQAASDEYRQKTGKPLLGSDMTQANAVIRSLIGDPIASSLDATIQSTLQGPDFQQMLQHLIGMTLRNPITVPDPLYGNASMDEIVNARLGAMGVV